VDGELDLRHPRLDTANPILRLPRTLVHSVALPRTHFPRSHDEGLALVEVQVDGGRLRVRRSGCGEGMGFGGEIGAAHEDAAGSGVWLAGLGRG